MNAAEWAADEVDHTNPTNSQRNSPHLIRGRASLAHQSFIFLPRTFSSAL